MQSIRQLHFYSHPRGNANQKAMQKIITQLNFYSIPRKICDLKNNWSITQLKFYSTKYNILIL